LEIVGVVGNVHEGTLDDVPALTVYANAAQRPQSSSLTMVVRAQSDPALLIPSMRQAVQSLNREMPMKFRTLSDVYSSSLYARRFSLVIFGVLAAVTLILATLGLYSVVSYTVAQRTREIGIRRALGAQGRDVLSLVLRRGLALTLCGVCLGLAGSFALTRLMKSLLFGVTAHDPLTLTAVTLLLAVVALVACLVPARRATKVDPLVALRYE
jgi:putative ABC transport system permease protein